MRFDGKIEQQPHIHLGMSDVHRSSMMWCEYHGITKHSVASLKRAPHVLDWANMPDPFRHYEGVPLLELPADPPVPETQVLEILNTVSGTTSAADGQTFLSQLLFYSAAISASKRVPSNRISIRVTRESILRESAPYRVPLPHTRPEGVAQRAVSLPALRAHGRAACARQS